MRTDAIMSFCKKRLMHTSSFDLPLVMSLKPGDESQLLIEQYYDFHKIGIICKIRRTNIRTRSDR